MPENNKVIWAEGMFLRHQHFQQEERYVENYINEKFSMLTSYAWGVAELSIDQQHLALGRIAINNARGIFPDGTPFDTADGAVLSKVLELPKELHNQLVYLAIPLQTANSPDIDVSGDEILARNTIQEQNIHDSTGENQAAIQILTGKLRLQLLLADDDRSQFSCIPVCRVLEIKEDGSVIIDQDYIAPILNCHASTKLAGYLRELYGTLQFRSEELAHRVANPSMHGTKVMTDFFLLQLINRYESFIKHLNNKRNVAPQDLYEELLKLAGELATYTSTNKRLTSFPEYKHEDLYGTFERLMGILREFLITVLDKNVVSLQIQESKQGIKVALLKDRTILNNSEMVVAVKAAVSDQTLRNRFPAQVKIAPVEKIRDLISSQVPGLGLEALPVAPPELPYHAGFVYFRLQQTGELWTKMKESSGFAFYISGDLPNIELEFWAIKR